jgi:hypothetical protein
MLRLLIVFLGLSISVVGYAQTLTISSTTQTTSSGTTWQQSNNVLTVYGNSTINASTIVSWLSSSSLTILGNTNAITVNINENIISSAAGNGLTIGNSNSTGTVTFNNTVNLMGALTVYAEKINLGSAVVQDFQSAQLIAGGSTGSISLSARNGFETLATTGTTRGKIMTTGGGSIQVNADTDNNNSGQLNIDWLTFDGGTGNILIEASSYSWNTGSGVVLPEFYGSGAFTFRNVPNANHIFSSAWIAVFGNFSGLTLGSNSGVEEILLAPCTVCDPSAKNYTGATWQIAGPINLYGSKVTVDLSLKSTLANADILFTSKSSINVTASKSITSNNGDITFWANSDGTANATEGDFVGIQNAVVINSANGSTTQSSGGGTITMAGGTTTQTLASGTIVPTAYAYSNRTSNWGGLPPGGINFGFNTAANSQQNSLSIYSGGGDIVIKGKSNSSSAGIQWFSGMPGASQIIHSGNGTILFDGLGTSSNAHGIELNSYSASGGVTPTITSSSSSNTAIQFVGETSATADRAGFQGAATLIANTAGGGIEISGITPSSSTYGAVEAGGILTYALTGPITFIGSGSGGLKIGGTWGKGSLPSSSSNITIRSNVFTLNTPTIQTSGTITVEPFGTSFTNAISFPITNLNLPNTITGLTLGKSTNTSDVTIGSATTISGPITIYGGNISLNQNLNTTGGNALGDILCKASGNIVLAASKSINSAGGDIILWANSDNQNSAGSVALRTLSSIVTGSNSVPGGHVWIGGGSDGGTWNGMTVGSGYAVPGTIFTPPAGNTLSSGVYLEGNSISTFGGNVKILGNTPSGGRAITSYGSISIDTKAGTIEIEGNATNSAIANAYGILFGIHDVSTASNVTLASSAAGNAITLSGFARGTDEAIGLSGVLTALSTGTGNILFNGTSYGTGTAIKVGNYYHGKLNAYAASGSITFNGGVKGLEVASAINGLTPGPSKLNIGQGGGITSSSSPVIFTGDILSIGADGMAVNTSGSLTIQPSSTSFTNALTYPMTNMTVANTITGLTIGKTTNTSDVTIGSATTIAGPMTVYAGNININQNLNTSGGGVNGDVLVKATGNINLAAAKTITTAAGDVNLWSDSDNNSTGYVQLLAGAAINSTGGDINLGGGSDLALDYAMGTTAETCPEATGTQYISGVHFRQGSSLTSTGGNISVRGQNANTANSAMSFGISLRGVSMNAGTGKIAINGVANGSGSVNAQGVASWGTLTLRSANTSSDAISITGNAMASTGASSLGINLVALFEATGTGGGIVINGKSGVASTNASVNIGGDILAVSGPITLSGENFSGVQDNIFMGSTTVIGKKSGTNVTTSSSNVILEGNKIVTSGSVLVDCSGTLTVQPFGTSFASALSWPMTNVTHASNLGGLTLGKLNNAANITIGAATSINGPITLHGTDLTLNAGLTTTNNSTGNIIFNGAKLLGAGTIALATGRSLTANLSGTSEFTGNISGTTISLTKTGAGTLTLNPTNALVFETATLTSGGLTIAASKQLTVNSTLTNNGTFTMKDGATFVQATSGTSIDGTGTYTVEKALTDNNSTWSTTSGRFWYMGVPMVNVARDSYGSPGTTTNRVWSYSEASKSYTELSNANDVLSAGTGYVHRRSTDGTLTFSATGANGLYGSDYSVSGLTKTAGYTSGVNLVSNPYMGFLDWNAVYNASTNIDPTFYIRSNNTTGNNISALISYNASTNTSTNTSSVTATTSQIRYIAPMQSIWVKVGAAASTGTVNMSRSMLSHQTGNTLKSSTVFPTLARVNLVDGNLFDQLLVYMNGDMTNEVDQYDSEKLPVSGTVQVYTMASNKKLVMNGLKNNKKKVSVPLYLELPETKSYTLQLSEYVLEDGLILLEDKQEGTMQDFTLLENYTFYANSGQLSNRFVLHFILPDAEYTTQGPSNSWVGPETSYTDGGNVEITNDDRGNIEITVDQAEEQKVEGNVTVTDMNGKEVYKGQLDGITTAVSLNVPAGIYYLTVQSGILFEKKKVFIQE